MLVMVDPGFLEHSRCAHVSRDVAAGMRGAKDREQRASVQRLRKKGVGIGKIARTLGIGASYVQRVVAETEAT